MNKGHELSISGANNVQSGTKSGNEKARGTSLNDRQSIR